MTRKEERELKKLNNPVKDLLKVTNSYFKKLIPIMNNVKDARHKSYITYKSSELLYPMLMADVMTIGNMRGIKHYFNNDACIENFSKILGNEDLEELPHHDTINEFLKILEPKELEKIRKYMINQLLNKRSFEDYRLSNKYWIIAIDGTGIHSFKERHCKHCLTRTTENKETGEKTTLYYHCVLEAKLIVGDLVFSIGTEFIENEKENISKQDCEINAFIRLATKLKEDYKRLPICIIGDALYATEGVRDICTKNKWAYIIRYKKGRSINLFEEYTMIKGIEKNNKNVIKKEQDQIVEKKYEWVNNIAYKNENIHVVELTEKIEEKS